jgi:hypothetical protein
LATVLLIAFVFYLYAPDLIFRFGASSIYGLRTAKTTSQVREFFAAALPSLFLNLETLALFMVARRLFKGIWFLPDVEQIKPLLAKDPSFAALTADDLIGPLFFLGALYVNSFRVGLAYGEQSRQIAVAGGILEYFATRSSLVYARYRQWYLFYSRSHDPFYPIVVRSSTAYVHTRDAIFHGRIVQNDKDRDGDNEAIYLVDVAKYSRAAQDQMLERGENPITQMSGPVYIKWHEIVDINFPLEPDDSLERKRQYFAERLRNAPHQKPFPIRFRTKPEDDPGGGDSGGTGEAIM